MTVQVPLIEVSGSHFDCGVMYGRQARDRIVLGVSHYMRQLGESAFGGRELSETVKKITPLIEEFDSGLLDEMRGIASGAAISFDEVVLLNARTEVLRLAAPNTGRKVVDTEPDGCTAVVILPETAANGHLIHAQNWDWKHECAETAVVLRVRRDDGPDLITFTEAGGLARAGFNTVGVAITGNYLESDRDYLELGVPLALIRRKALEQEHLAQSIRLVYATAKSASNNMVVSHAQGLVINFECAPDETFLVHASDGLLVHANHWMSQVALSKLRDTGIKNTPDSLYRDLRVQQLLDPHRGHIGTEHVKAALFDTFGTPWSVCRPPRPSASSNLSATVAMIVMEPGAGRMEVAMLPAHNRSFQRFTLETSFKAVPPILAGEI